MEEPKSRRHSGKVGIIILIIVSHHAYKLRLYGCNYTNIEFDPDTNMANKRIRSFPKTCFRTADAYVDLKYKYRMEADG